MIQYVKELFETKNVKKRGISANSPKGEDAKFSG